MTDRYFTNSYSDYHGEQYLSGPDQLIPQLSSTIVQWIEKQMKNVEENLRYTDSSDGSVYTGSAGIALLYLRLSLLFPEQKSSYLSKAKDLVRSALNRMDERVATFYCGDPGPLAIAAVIDHHQGDAAEMQKRVDKILAMKSVALTRSTPNEYLFGRAGYLYTLMFLRREISSHLVPDELITEVFEAIIQSGEQYARDTRSKSLLMFQWHRTEYLGAAHGVSGIIYLLLKITQHQSFAHLQPYIHSHLIPTIDFLKTRQFNSGNYMSSNDAKSDDLVQWCHGAPGFAYAFARAYQATGDASYLERALAAGDVVWKRGLLRKGYGLCHGVSGNAYVFLDLYHATQDLKWLHRAIKFAEFCLDMGKHNLSRQPDAPFSLMEGLAGTIIFMADLLHPNTARFPGFD